MKGKVIVIEDDKHWKRKLSQYLKEADFHVEVASDLETGLEKIKNENFHFATVDLQLNKNTQNPSEFEGWEILEEIVKFRHDRTMPTMVVSGFKTEYEKFSKLKELYGTFFMPKKNFDKKKFITSINGAVETLGVRFYDDKKEEE